MSKRQFKLDITIAVEAESVDEAFELLVSENTLNHINSAIKESKDKIIESFKDNDINEETMIIN